ncbi:hypothetical protein Tbis_1216 [Thermobispora bispora DSM 43833]|jgi:hypothetical protein|uniref:Uncharacterized protein n=1 Tax=Thermobispora bispora (strain ATCC 19993 / DSM 43833 / CBS 139.67 / JCM 10125 / KCTC 9307 / NBRC 14880 / R51) TaxID=469371 RepID=D6Y8P0_THEBD|nr:hypothetical protein Tbis_1216 [Thermobispora bispora DSM 43833]
MAGHTGSLRPVTLHTAVPLIAHTALPLDLLGVRSSTAR